MSVESHHISMQRTALGPDDRLIIRSRPQWPEWISEEQYAEIPWSLPLERIAANVVAHRPGRIEPARIVID